jgi:hypothetical protein
MQGEFPLPFWTTSSEVPVRFHASVAPRPRARTCRRSYLPVTYEDLAPRDFCTHPAGRRLVTYQLHPFKHCNLETNLRSSSSALRITIWSASSGKGPIAVRLLMSVAFVDPKAAIAFDKLGCTARARRQADAKESSGRHAENPRGCLSTACYRNAKARAS